MECQFWPQLPHVSLEVSFKVVHFLYIKVTTEQLWINQVSVKNDIDFYYVNHCIEKAV